MSNLWGFSDYFIQHPILLLTLLAHVLADFQWLNAAINKAIFDILNLPFFDFAIENQLKHALIRLTTRLGLQLKELVQPIWTKQLVLEFVLRIFWIKKFSVNV